MAINLPFYPTRLANVYLILIITFFFIFYFVSSIYTLRFGIWEDFEVLYMISQMNANGFWDSVLQQLKFETQGRFRPIYIIYRHIFSLLFSDNFLLHHLFFYLITVGNAILTFTVVRKLDFSHVLGLFIVLLIFFGSQIMVFWRLGSAESLATFFTMISTLSFLKFCTAKRVLYYVFYFLFALLATLTKESFIVVFALPPLLKWVESDIRFTKSHSNIRHSLIAVGVILGYVLLVRGLLQDPDAMQYAGGSFSVYSISVFIFGYDIYVPFKEQIHDIIKHVILINSEVGLYFYLIFILIIINVVLKNKPHFILILFFLGLILFQKLIYLRVPLNGIYLFPTILFIVFLISYLVNKTKKQKLLYKFILIVIILLSVYQINKSYHEIKVVVQENRVYNKALSNITNLSHENENLIIQTNTSVFFELVSSVIAYNDFYKIPLNVYIKTDYPITNSEKLELLKMSDESLIPLLDGIVNHVFSDKIITQENNYLTQSEKTITLHAVPNFYNGHLKILEDDMVVSSGYVGNIYKVYLIVNQGLPSK